MSEIEKLVAEIVEFDAFIALTERAGNKCPEKAYAPSGVHTRVLFEATQKAAVEMIDALQGPHFDAGG